MNKEQLKTLVKLHFNLVDKITEPTSEKFGEIMDENNAFKFIFPGESIKVGDEVKVVTTDGQETTSPDGYHKLSDGITIKTENSIVTEISSADEEAEEEMMTEEFAADPSISNVEGTTPQNPTTVTDEPNAEAAGDALITTAEVEAQIMAKVKMAIDEAIAGLKEEMSIMNGKFETIAKAPASTKTILENTPIKTENFSTATNDTHMNAMRELIKNKNK